MASIKSVAMFMICVLLYTSSFSQEATLHQKINKDMYGNFSEAFKKLDFNLFESIHSKEMIRVSGGIGGEIKTVQEYLSGYKKRWNDPKKKAYPIDFRLFERIISDSLVSDRGIYRVTYKDDQGATSYSYGQFHVVLGIENDSWKILLDYDSNEKNTIDKDSFDKAYPLSDYKKYWKPENK